MKVLIFLTFDRTGRECCKKLSELEDVRVCKEVINDVCNGVSKKKKNDVCNGTRSVHALRIFFLLIQ